MNKRILMPRRLSQYREKMFKDIWDRYKAELSMSEIAEIVHHNVSQFYKIISKKIKK